MSQKIACPTCAKSLLVPDDAVGKKVRCPGCQTLIELAPVTEFREAPRAAAPREAAPPPPPGRGDYDDDEPRRRSRPAARDRGADDRYDDERTEELSSRRRPAKSSGSAGIIILVSVVSVLAIGGVVAVVLLTSGSSPNPGGVARGGSALDFNNLLSGGNQRLANAGRTFGESLGRALNSGNQGDMATMRTQYAAVQRVLGDVRRDVNNFNSGGIGGADQLRAVYLQFLDGQDRMIRQDFAEAMTVVENRGLNNFDKQNRVTTIMNRVQGQENNDLVRLQQAQREFANRHGIMLR